MRTYIDIDSRKFVESPAYPRAVVSASFKRRDTLRLEISFVRSGQIVELGAGATGSAGIKRQGDYAGPFLSFGPSWQKSGSGADAVYAVSMTLATAETDAAFAAANEPESVACMLEVQWVDTGDVSTSETLSATVANDVIRGNEATPSPSSPQSSFQLSSPDGTAWSVSISDQGTIQTTAL